MTISFRTLIAVAFLLLPTAALQSEDPWPTPAISDIMKLDAPHTVAYAIKERPLKREKGLP